VDDADVEDALLPACPQVLDDELLHITRVKKMQVEVPIDWNFDHFLLRGHFFRGRRGLR
jgi:hypothetical protein